MGLNRVLRGSKEGLDAKMMLLDPLEEQVYLSSAALSRNVALGVKTGLDVPKTLSIGKLRKNHTGVLIETTEVLHLVVASVPMEAPLKDVKGKVVHHLRKDQSD